MEPIESLIHVNTFLRQVKYLTKVKYEVFRFSNFKYQVEVTIYNVTGSPAIKSVDSFIVETQGGMPDYLGEINTHFEQHKFSLT